MRRDYGMSDTRRMVVVYVGKLDQTVFVRVCKEEDISRVWLAYKHTLSNTAVAGAFELSSTQGIRAKIGCV